MNTFSLKDKTIVVTGASSGIGRSAAIACDNHGATLILIGRNKKRLKNTQSELSAKNHKILIIDLTDFEKLSLELKFLLDNITTINGIIHAAGISITIPFRVFSPNKLEEIFKINVTAAFQLTKLLHPKINTNSSIVFISSIMANVGEKGKIMYSMTKGAISAGSRSLALEYASKKIRVNTVAPGIVNTPMTSNATYKTNQELHSKTLESYPLGFGEPEDIANACVFLLSDASRWITGSEIIIDGGFSAN